MNDIVQEINRTYLVKLICDKLPELDMQKLIEVCKLVGLK